MRNISNDFKIFVSQSLFRIFVQNCFLEEFFFIFPQLSKISFQESNFLLLAKEKIKQKFILSVLPGQDKSLIDLMGPNFDVDQNINFALSEVQKMINNSNTLKDFNFRINLFDVLGKFDSESSITPSTFLDQEKFSESFFFEVFVEPVETNFDPVGMTGVQRERLQALIDRDQKFKKVVKISDWTSFLQNEAKTTPDEDFFKLFPKLNLCLRLVFNMKPKDVSANILLQAQNNLKSSKENQEEKKNIIYGRFDENGFNHHFFPIVLAKVSFDLSSKIRENKKQSFVDFLSDQNQIDDLISSSLRVSMILSREYQILFDYIFPMKTVDILFLNKEMKKNALIKEVFKQNRVYSNVSAGIIKLIDKVLNSEDPRKI